MFDYFPEPWKGTSIPVSIAILEVGTGKRLINTLDTAFDLIHDSLYFSSKSLNFTVRQTLVNEKKNCHHIRFPLHCIKFFEIHELFAHKDDLSPQSYKITFHATLTCKDCEIELKDDAA